MLGCKSQVSGDVMATVDGRKIFRSDVDKYYENQIASAQQAPVGEQATILRLNILRQMIDDEIVMRRAEKLGLLATEDEVDLDRQRATGAGRRTGDHTPPKHLAPDDRRRNRNAPRRETRPAGHRRRGRPRSPARNRRRSANRRPYSA